MVSNISPEFLARVAEQAAESVRQQEERTETKRSAIEQNLAPIVEFMEHLKNLPEIDGKKFHGSVMDHEIRYVGSMHYGDRKEKLNLDVYKRRDLNCLSISIDEKGIDIRYGETGGGRFGSLEEALETMAQWAVKVAPRAVMQLGTTVSSSQQGQCDLKPA